MSKVNEIKPVVSFIKRDLPLGKIEKKAVETAKQVEHNRGFVRQDALVGNIENKSVAKYTNESGQTFDVIV